MTSFSEVWQSGALETGCIELFNHEFWQSLNDENVAKLAAHLGITEPIHVQEDGACGYCGNSLNPNDICRICFDSL